MLQGLTHGQRFIDINLNFTQPLCFQKTMKVKINLPTSLCCGVWVIAKNHLSYGKEPCPHDLEKTQICHLLWQGQKQIPFLCLINDKLSLLSPFVNWNKMLINQICFKLLSILQAPERTLIQPQAESAFQLRICWILPPFILLPHTWFFLVLFTPLCKRPTLSA